MSERQLDEVVAGVRRVLGPDLRGAYLYGSAVLGVLRPDSDLDVFAVSRRRTTPEEKQRLISDLFAVSGRDAGRRVELTIVVESEVRPWRHPPRIDFQYGEWLRSEFERGELEPWEENNPDLASLITMVLLANTPLAGPAPAEVLDAVPRRDHARAMVGSIESLLDDLESDTGNVILTLARIWSTIETDSIRSKDGAADWALARLPPEHHAVLARARAIYVAGGKERWDDLQGGVRPLADRMAREIEQAAASVLR